MWPALSGTSQSAAASCERAFPWQGLSPSGADLLEPAPLVLLGSAVAAPWLMAPSGADHELRLVAQRSLGGRYNQEPISVWAPFVLAAGTGFSYSVSSVWGPCRWRQIGAAVIQGATLTAGVTGLLKWTVGREFPAGGADPHASDRLEHPERATEYEPFGVVLRAWPSGHTAVSVAFAATLRSAAPELGPWRWSGYVFGAAVAFGMWHGDHHWASDIVSGAALGEAVGSSVGTGFNGSGFNDRGTRQAQLIFLPGSGGGELQWARNW